MKPNCIHPHKPNVIKTLMDLVSLPLTSADFLNNSIVGSSDSELSKDDFRILDEAAKLAVNPDINLNEIRRLYRDTPDIQPPKSYLVS